jgi:hypothetical protein
VKGSLSRLLGWTAAAFVLVACLPTSGLSASRRPGRSPSGWSRPVTVAPGASLARVVTDQRGNSLIFWNRHGTFFVRPFSWAGALGVTQVVWPSAMGAVQGQDGYVSAVYGSRNGQVLMTWQRERDQAFFMRTRSRTGVLGPLLQPAAPSGGKNLIIVDGLVANDGTATVLFIVEMHATPTGGTPYPFLALYLQQILPTGASSPPVLIDEGNSSYDVTSEASQEGKVLGVDDAGNVDMLWLRTPNAGGACCTQLWSRSYSSAGLLSPAQSVSPANTNVLFYNQPAYLTVDGSGTQTFVWRRPFDLSATHTQQDIEARSKTATGILGPVLTLSPILTSYDTLPEQTGTQLFDLFVRTLANGAAIGETRSFEPCARSSCYPRTRYAFLERSVMGDRAGANHTLATNTAAAFDYSRVHNVLPDAGTGQLESGGDRALAIWLTQVVRVPGRFGIGLSAASISRGGRLSPATTLFAAGTLTSSYISYGAAVGANDREVVAAATVRHGLQVISHK